jgi:glycosyltransferase involved in cell wall biosynthesis
MRILFISRAYPPVTGGIENQNYALSVWLNKVAQTETIANRHGKKFLPFFFPYATLQALCRIHRYDVLLLGDGVLAPLGFIVKLLYPKKTVVSVVHGLDITYTNAFYQKFWVRTFLPALDGLIAVGHETIRQGVARGIPEAKFAFIPNGVDTEAHFKTHTRQELETLLGLSVENTVVLLTSGRLAKRKGVAWFIRNVIPKLPENTLYVVAGDGIDKNNIEQAVTETNSAHHVKLLGYVSDEVRDILFNTCDIFIQPNIRVAGDMEGFGISVIEAASCELPVIVSDLEGLKDAIHQNENGLLVEPENPEAFVKVITELVSDEEKRHTLGKRARLYTKAHFEWDVIAQRYIEILQSFVKK